MVMAGGIEMLMLLFFAGGPLGDLLGLPPGERDAKLVQAASENSVIYLEWAERSPGKPGAKGVDGLVADPEVRNFINRITAAVKAGISEDFEGNPQAQQLMESVPGFVIAFSGRPGCVFASLKEGDIPPGADGPMAMLASLEAGLVINGGEKADDFSKQIATYLAPLGIDPAGDFDHTPLPLPIPAELHRHDNYLILGIGAGTVNGIVNRLKESAGGLGDNPTFKAAASAVSMERTGSVTWLDLKNGVDGLTKVLGPAGDMVPQVLEMIGLRGVEYVVSSVGVVDGQVKTRVNVKTDGKLEGLMSLVAGRGMTADDFAFVPSDSDLVLAFSFDAKKAVDGIRGMVSNVQPGAEAEFDQSIEFFEQEFGLNLQKDIIDAFGSVVTISNSPGDGGWLATSPVLTLEVRKPAGAFKTVAKFAEYFDRNGTQRDEDGRKRRGRGEYLERKEFMGQRIYMVNMVGDDDYIVAPSFAVTRTHLMIALHPQPLKSRLRRSANQDSWKTFQFTPPENGDAIAYSFLRTEELMDDCYGFLPWVAQSVMSMIQREGVEIDAFDFPSAQALLPYMGDTNSMVVRTENGFQMETTAPPFIGSLTSAPVMWAPLVLFGARAAPPAAIEMDAIEDAPAARPAAARPAAALQPAGR